MTIRVATGRRLRGALLRLVRRRGWALGTGVALIAPAVWLLAGDYQWEGWATDGASLVLAATGAALVFIGLSGPGPDWVEPS